MSTDNNPNVYALVAHWIPFQNLKEAELKCNFTTQMTELDCITFQHRQERRSATAIHLFELCDMDSGISRIIAHKLDDCAKSQPIDNAMLQNALCNVITRSAKLQWDPEVLQTTDSIERTVELQLKLQMTISTYATGMSRQHPQHDFHQIFEDLCIRAVRNILQAKGFDATLWEAQSSVQPLS